VKKLRRKVQQFIDKWTWLLGLRWWSINVHYVKDKKGLKHHFKSPKGTTTRATVYSDWRYAEATIYINLPSFVGLSDDRIERIILHELCHILVCEMREGDLHHEERVVSGLTKAFMWTRTLKGEGK
jgi:hypothetical protein